MANYDEYLVCRHTNGDILAICDTMKEARAEIARLQARDIMLDTFAPFTYEIKGVIEYDRDIDGQPHCAKYVVDIDGGLIP